MTRWLQGGVALVLLCYAALCAWMYAHQRRLVYYPQFTRMPAAATNFALQRDGVTLRGWVVNPGERRALVYFGGNGEEVSGNRGLFAQALPAYSVYLVAYRGYGASDGEPSQPALLGDALALFDHVQRAHPDAPVSLIGRSLGSGVASHVAAQRAIGRLALITPFDSLVEVAQMHYSWLPVRWLLRERYDSVAALANYRGPLLIVRAGRDEVIPAANTDHLIATLKPAPLVVTSSAAGHNTLDDAVYGHALTGFFDPSVR